MKRFGVPTIRFELGRAQRTLRQGEATPEWLGQWVPRTWEEPEVFREELLIAAAGRRGLECKSRPDTGIALYYDLVLQHVGKRRVALVTFDRGAEVETTFDELHERSSLLSTRWRAAGVEPGQGVGLLLPVGLDLAVTFLTALRLGLVPCFLPPQGRGWARRRLEALRPDWLVVGSRQEPWVSDAWPRLERSASSGDTTFAGSRTWGLEDVASRAFSPFGTAGAALAEPTEVSAGALLLGALRDGWLLLGLEPGERLGALGLDPLQHQPSLLCAAWAAGAAWVELPADDQGGDARSVLGRSRVDVLGLSSLHRARVLEAARGPLRKQLRLWFRGLEDVFDFEAWAAFQAELHELKMRGLGWLQVGAAGGAHHQSVA
jgi:hypothetical protein